MLPGLAGRTAIAAHVRLGLAGLALVWCAGDDGCDGRRWWHGRRRQGGALCARLRPAARVAWRGRLQSLPGLPDAFEHCFALHVMPSRFAFSRIANSLTDVWLIPSFWASTARRRLASGLRRILVMCFFSIAESVAQIRYKCMGTCQRSHHCRSSASSVSRSGPAKHRECPSASVRVRWSMIAS
jgi:hypothetical protein